MIAPAAAAAVWLMAPSSPPPAALPTRVQRLVVHALGGPSYREPLRRFVFFPPPQTHALWRPAFGAHWIVWTDGTLWPRHPAPGEPPSWRPEVAGAATAADRQRLAREASRVYGHVYRANSHSVGIELAHSGRSRDAFADAQVRSLAWLLHTLLEMSNGRLGPADIVGHKDLDRRPAYVRPGCERPGCPVFADAEGRPYRRRVDPPESVFPRLAREGLFVPRPPDGDAELRRAEGMGPGVPPTVRLKSDGS
ncbi:MAG TPA: N-acetylmuramoyl-L-alanine amidase [Vicinamibacteria bacterium]|nr:N-acetylmuramoyl-L-alanine amidase [Vicinamibacteria bacterium]